MFGNRPSVPNLREIFKGRSARLRITGCEPLANLAVYEVVAAVPILTISDGPPDRSDSTSELRRIADWSGSQLRRT